MPPEGVQVSFVPPRLDVPRQGHVAEAAPCGERSYEVRFAEIGDRDGAEALVGCHCLVLRADVADLLQEAAPLELRGFAVKEGEDPIGIVTDILENPGQWLLEVRRDEGGSPLLIPFVEPIVTAVDHEARVIAVTLPDGLLDL